jgi:hypothetical protein
MEADEVIAASRLKNDVCIVREPGGYWGDGTSKITFGLYDLKS